MARVRQARRCRGRRSSGQPCRAWAIRGGFVCRAHGGAAPAVRDKVNRRLEIARIYREFAAADERYEWDLRRWRIDQILTTARLLKIDIEDVTRQHIWLCHLRYGVPPLAQPPRRTERDRRFGKRAPPLGRQA